MGAVQTEKTEGGERGGDGGARDNVQGSFGAILARRGVSADISSVSSLRA